MSSADLYDITYRLLMERCRMTEEEVEAQDKTRQRIYNLIFEAETGMPALSSIYRPADEV